VCISLVILTYMHGSENVKYNRIAFSCYLSGVLPYYVYFDNC